jgi:Zn-dependent protease
MLDRRLKLGTFWGIGLYVHWTFALLILYFAYQARGEGIAGIAFSLAIVIGVFFCVTLHEYGHALAARKFGIPTIDITLLPIGGVARLQRMPRIPWQELLVAVAGPAVNVAIATLLGVGFFIAGGFSLILGGASEAQAVAANTLFGEPSFAQFFRFMLGVNLMLVLFNMIPAFPMDGGRVFRSILAMMIDYRRATWFASRVGLVCATLMVLLVLVTGASNPFLILIAVFIGFAGMSEARQVEVMESVRGLTVREVMVQSQDVVSMDTPLGEIARQWQTLGATALPVVSIVGTVVGMIRLEEVAAALAAGQEPTTPVGQLVDHETSDGAVGPDDELETVISRIGQRGRQLPVVDQEGHLQGILDLNSMLLRGRLARHLHNAIIPDDRFDAFS